MKYSGLEMQDGQEFPTDGEVPGFLKFDDPKELGYLIYVFRSLILGVETLHLRLIQDV
jgi:hypothetical protein